MPGAGFCCACCCRVTGLRPRLVTLPAGDAGAAGAVVGRVWPLVCGWVPEDAETLLRTVEPEEALPRTVEPLLRVALPEELLPDELPRTVEPEEPVPDELRVVLPEEPFRVVEVPVLPRRTWPLFCGWVAEDEEALPRTVEPLLRVVLPEELLPDELPRTVEPDELLPDELLRVAVEDFTAAELSFFPAEVFEERVVCLAPEFCREVVVPRFWEAEERVCASTPDGAARSAARMAAARAEVIDLFIFKEF